MRKIDYISGFSSGLILLSMSMKTATVNAQKKPNIIVILTDDQEYKTMKSWGGDVLTPNIDKLVNEGVKFTRAYVAASESAPSRYSILTGRYHGRCQGEQYLADAPLGTQSRSANEIMTIENNLDNLPKTLKANGYNTGMVGKWHLGYHFSTNETKLPTQMAAVGLQYYTTTDDPADPLMKAKLLNNHTWYANEIKKSGFDYADNVYWANLAEVHNDLLNFHNQDWTVKGALDFLDQTGEKPFFLYFSTTLDHGPNPQSSVVGKELISGKGYLDAALNVLPNRASLTSRLNAAGLGGKKLEYTLWLDDAVGALMKNLETSGKLDNTLIIFMSDNGLEMKAAMYEGGIRVPMMVWWKGHTTTGGVCSRLVHGCDIAPTIMEATNSTIPATQKFDGVSFIPLLTDNTKPWRKYVYCELGWAKCIVTEDYKYIAVRYPADIQAKVDRGLTADEQITVGYIPNQSLCALGKKNPNYFDNNQLYNLVNDPNELTNLINNPTYAAKYTELRNIMKLYCGKFKQRPFGDLYDGVSFVPEIADTIPSFNSGIENLFIKSVKNNCSQANQLYVSPNPITEGSKISFIVNNTQKVQIDIFNSQGAMVVKLMDKKLSQGKYELNFPEYLSNNEIYFVMGVFDNCSQYFKVMGK